MFSGSVRVRDRLPSGRDAEGKVTAIRVFDRGSAEQRATISAGEIGKLWGLAGVRIGDDIGAARTVFERPEFAPPMLETIVAPRSPADKGRLRAALGQLAEQDPFINVRLDDVRHELSVTLYGEVQKEVIQATLAHDFGLEVTFHETTTICIERPTGRGTAIETLQQETTPFSATVGLRVDPAPRGSGIEFRLAVDSRSIPLYIYGTSDRFAEYMTQYVCRTLEEGLFGWPVTDCIVTMTDSDYFVGDGRAKAGATRTTAADFRRLTPLVLMRALEEAGIAVCEPVLRVRIETPTERVGAVLALVTRLGTVVKPPSLHEQISTIVTIMPAARLRYLQRRLPGLTGGEGVIETAFEGYDRVSGPPPRRRRMTPDPPRPRGVPGLARGRRPPSYE
jgi:ribosomal protection tetracycline resistance protein